jgi:hypothetical protein
LLVLVLLGRPRLVGVGWTIGLLTEPLWVAYAIATSQWGFLLNAVPYAVVYAVNLRTWRASRRAAA